MADLALVLGDQLFADPLPFPEGIPVLMIEDRWLCTRVRHHRQKLVLFLSAMRHYARRVEDQGFDVRYTELDLGFSGTIFDRLREMLPQGATLHLFDPADRYFLPGLHAAGIRTVTYANPMFLTGRAEWQTYRGSHKRLFMADFYRFQRLRLGLLLDANKKPLGGKWSFDEENRKPLPKRIDVPLPWYVEPDPITREVIGLVDRSFPDHPGKASDFRYPVTSTEAEEWLETFAEQRLAQFGDYEDALSREHRVAFHSLLSPLMNTGLLTPRRVLEVVLAKPGIPLNSLEGFVRQVIGWREFVRWVEAETEIAETPNALGHTRRLGAPWYDGTTGLPPLDDVIKRCVDHAWCHHIERLMVVGSAMLMCEVEPKRAYDWFMEMCLDSADWVMAPNVYGMSQFADHGRFTTKPYLSGSSYLRRMGDTPEGEWCEVWDGLYWRFIDRHRDIFEANPRTQMTVRSFDRLEPSRKERILNKAERFIQETTFEA